MTDITEMPIDHAARDLARAQSTLMIESFARDLVESCQEYGLDAATESVPNVIGPESVSELVVEALRDSADKPTKCQMRLIKVLQGHLEETHLYREQLVLAYRSLARAGTIEAGDSLGEMRVRQRVGVEEYSGLASGEATAADRGESEA